jgi:hypothetical protein
LVAGDSVPLEELDARDASCYRGADDEAVMGTGLAVFVYGHLQGADVDSGDFDGNGSGQEEQAEAG